MHAHAYAAVNGDNALISAAKSGSVEYVEILINAGANLEARTDNGSTPGAHQHTCCPSVHATDATALPEHLACIPCPLCSHMVASTLTAVMVAAGTGSAACVKALLRAGAQVDATNNAGLTAPLFACKAYSAECLEALLDAGADVNAMGGHPGVTAWIV